MLDSSTRNDVIHFVMVYGLLGQVPYVVAHNGADPAAMVDIIESIARLQYGNTFTLPK